VFVFVFGFQLGVDINVFGCCFVFCRGFEAAADEEDEVKDDDARSAVSSLVGSGEHDAYGRSLFGSWRSEVSVHDLIEVTLDEFAEPGVDGMPPPLPEPPDVGADGFGASSSSGPMVPIAAVLPAAPGVPIPLHDGPVVIDVPSGTLTWYTDGRFKVVCKCEGHRKCTKERESTAGRRRCKGRPLGYMYYWLQCCSMFPDSDEHMRGDIFADFLARRQARTELAEIAGANALFRKERPKGDDEADSEPEECP
jgi:hypothetical protein